MMKENKHLLQSLDLIVSWPGQTLQFTTSSIRYYYMTRSVNGQDEPNLVPSRQDGTILPAWDTGFVPQGKFIMFWCFFPYNKSVIDQACSDKMAGYWPRFFFAWLWTLTSSQSINTQKRTWPISSHLDFTLGQ